MMLRLNRIPATLRFPTTLLFLATFLFLTTFLFLSLGAASPAAAMVGGAPARDEGAARAVVTIVGSRGTFCSGALIAPDLVLSAAHCVMPGADYKIVHYDAKRQPQLLEVRRTASHPQFNVQGIL